MTTTASNKFVVFYSWQDDSPKKTNKIAIRAALQTIANDIESAEDKLKVDIDEATKRVSGSPNIFEKIIDKIKNCDAFVADISFPLSGVKTPNPNVMLELGFAVAYLGWERIILLFNTEFGIVEDSPFDVRQNRISKYKLSPSDHKNKANIVSLNKLTSEAIKLIIEINPKKEIIHKALNHDEIKRQRDLKNIRELLCCINFPLLDELILCTPKKIPEKAIDLFAMFSDLYTGSLCHINEKKIEKAFDDLHTNWRIIVSGFSSEYDAHGHYLVFYMPGDLFQDSNSEKAWEAINEARGKLQKAINDLLTILRQNYIEIDAEETSRIALKRLND